MHDLAKYVAYRLDGKSVRAGELLDWHPHWRINKYDGVDLAVPELWARAERGEILPDDYYEFEGNLLTTVGATDLLTGLSTAGLATPFNTTNTCIGVGDSSSAAAVGQTDLQAAAGTKLNAADTTSATNATPIVVAGTYSPTPVVGAVVVCSAFGGAGAAAINNTFEMSAASASSITLLNSAGTGAITVAGGLVKPINRYLQIASGAGSAVVTTNQIVYVAVFGTANANFAWQEFATGTGQSATNKQATTPAHLLNRAVSNPGTKGSGASWTVTETVTLS